MKRTVSLLSGMKIDNKNLIVLSQMGKKMDRGSPGMKMDRRNVNIFTKKEKETKAGQRGGQMATQKLKEITRRIKRMVSLLFGLQMDRKS